MFRIYVTSSLCTNMSVEITKRNTPKNGQSSSSVISYGFHVFCLSKFVGLHAFLHIAKIWALFRGGGGG